MRIKHQEELTELHKKRGEVGDGSGVTVRVTAPLPLRVDLLWVTVSMETVLRSIEGRITMWTVSDIRIHEANFDIYFSQ